MLFEFHKSQNARKLGSIHATYLIYGTKSAELGLQSQADGDVEMSSSMPESVPEQVPILTLSLVEEGQLKGGVVPALRFKANFTDCYP